MTMTTMTTINIKDKKNGRICVDIDFNIFKKEQVDTAKDLLSNMYKIWLKTEDQCQETLADFLSAVLHERDINHQMVVYVDCSELE